MTCLSGYERPFNTTLHLDALDAVMEHLPAGPPLNAIAATSKALLALARPRIFRRVPLESTQNLYTYAALMTEIPHLPLYAHTVLIGPRRYVMSDEEIGEIEEPDPEDFDDIVQFRHALDSWNKWRDSRYHELRAKDRQTWWDAPELPTLLLALSRAEDLALYTVHWRILKQSPALRGAFEAFTHLTRLHLDLVFFERMADCQALVRSLTRISVLELVNVSIFMSNTEPEARAELPIALTSLVVAGDTIYPTPFIRWLASSLAPASLHRLATIWEVESGYSYIYPGDDLKAVPESILPRAGQNIKELELHVSLGEDPTHAKELIEELALSHCRSLRSLKLHLGDFTDSVGLGWLATLLNGISSPHISEIVLDADRDARWPAPEDVEHIPPFPALGPVIHALRRPALQELNVLSFRGDRPLRRIFNPADPIAGLRALDHFPLALARRFASYFDLRPEFEWQHHHLYAYTISDIGLEDERAGVERDMLVVQTQVGYPATQPRVPKEYLAGLVFLPHHHVPASQLP